MTDPTDPTDPFGEHHTAVQAHVDLGNLTYEEIARNLSDTADDPDNTNDQRDAQLAALTAMFADHRAWQENVADETTDAERLSRAFRTLDIAGVIAREEFGWGRGDIFHFLAGEREDAPRARGYVAATIDDYATGAVSLRFGVFTDQPEQDPTEQAAIGHEVVQALHVQGLRTDWNGSPGRVIDVLGRPRRRRYGRWAEYPGAPAEPRAGGGSPALSVSFFDERRDGGGIARMSDNAFVPVADRTWRELMYRLAPAKESFMIFQPMGGGPGVQMAWEQGPRLWMEIPEPARRLSRGAYVSLEQAETVVSALAADGRDVLGEVAEVEVRPW